MTSLPATTVIEGEELIQYLHPALLYLDYGSHLVHLTILISSLIAFSTCFCLSAFLSSSLQVYRHLDSKQMVFWNLSVVRALYGVFAATMGAWAIFVYNNHERDPIYGLTATSSFAMIVTAGFFLFESLSLTISDWRHGSLSHLLHVHHWLCLQGAVIIVLTGSGYHLGTICLALEMSTPFSALCWLLLKAGHGNSRLWTLNQMFLLHTFHLRSVVECYMWWVTYKHWSTIWADMPLSSFLVTYAVLILFTFVATPYWTYKKTVQLASPHDWNFQPEPSTQNGTAHKMD